MTRTEILAGRILSVRVRGPKLDVTVISIYAPMDAPNGEARDREEFWEILNNFLCHLPRRSAPWSLAHGRACGELRDPAPEPKTTGPGGLEERHSTQRAA